MLELIPLMNLSCNFESQVLDYRFQFVSQNHLHIHLLRNYNMPLQQMFQNYLRHAVLEEYSSHYNKISMIGIPILKEISHLFQIQENQKYHFEFPITLDHLHLLDKLKLHHALAVQ